MSKIEIRDVPPQDYPRFMELCVATFDYAAGQAQEDRIRKPVTLEQVEKWSAISYRREAVLDGKIIAFFYLSPPPDKRPKSVHLGALSTDPGTSYELQREAAYRLIRVAVDDYAKVGTKLANGRGWVGSLAHSILTDLGVPLMDGGVDPLTRRPIEYNVEVTLALVDELLRRQGL